MPTKPLAATAPLIAEIQTLCDEVQSSLRSSVSGALRIGLRLMSLHRDSGELDAPGGFRAALASLSTRVPASTAYRWINAASSVLCVAKGIEDPEELELPIPGTAEWKALEKTLTDHAKGTSLRRLILGAADSSTEDSRYHALIEAEESGDKHAKKILDQVAAGDFTLVQAIRALAGAKMTKEKTRNDPTYLDIDSRTGQPTGLFPKCLVTIANTFARWDQLSEPARREVKSAWKEVVSKLPKELR